MSSSEVGPTATSSPAQPPAQTPAGGPVDIPATRDFVRRSNQRLAIIGDNLYMEGGEICQMVNGQPPNPNQPSDPINSTLVLSLSTSWSTSAPPLRSISKLLSATPNTNPGSLSAPPPVNYPHVWSHAASGSLYAWGGRQPYLGLIPPNFVNSLFRLNTSGSPDGEGTWSAVPLSEMGTGGGVVGSNTAPSVFASLARGAEAALAQSASRGWALGGTVDAGTDPSYPLPGTYQPVPGLLEFDMRTLAFRNLTSPEMISALGGPHRSTVQGAVGQYIGGWGAREEKRQGGGEGEDGLVFFMAGTRPGVIPYVTSSTEYIDFGNLSIYEPATGRWFWQKATGDVPVGRMHTCTASTSGRTGSTEIFLFGGYNERLNTTFDDVHILTIPGFNWFRVNPSSTPTPRCWHACVTAGKGRRQMIAVGGVRPEFRWPRIWTDRDSLPQGIGVLDMTSLTWRDSFDASLPEYEQPDVVKQWYAGSGLSFVPWSSNEVKTLFLDGYAARQRAFNEGRDPAATPNSTSSDTGNPDDSMRDADRSAPVATIVGAVLGSVAFLVLCVLLLCVCYRKRQRRYAAQLAAEEEERAVVAMRRAGTGELDVENNHAELHGSSVTRHELPAREEVTKPASYPPAELDGEREKWPVLTSSSERNGKRE